MRALIGGVGALLLVATMSCADQGNLTIRCPDAGGAIAVTGGLVMLDGVAMRVTADLSVPAAPAGGMTFAIDIQLPDSPGVPSPAVECVRVRLGRENAQWDAVPSLIHEVRDGSTVRIRATKGQGPHFSPDNPVDVTIWLKTRSGRRVLTLGRQSIHRVG